jgi:two-component system sensor histidine kinase UhpB
LAKVKLRESLSNALRHGRPSRIDVDVRPGAGNTVAVTVVDDGDGMKPPGSVIGFGITGMQERVASLGGIVTVKNRIDGKGVMVTARLPLQAPSEFLANEVREDTSS